MSKKCLQRILIWNIWGILICQWRDSFTDWACTEHNREKRNHFFLSKDRLVATDQIKGQKRDKVVINSNWVLSKEKWYLQNILDRSNQPWSPLSLSPMMIDIGKIYQIYPEIFKLYSTYSSCPCILPSFFAFKFLTLHWLVDNSSISHLFWLPPTISYTPTLTWTYLWTHCFFTNMSHTQHVAWSWLRRTVLVGKGYCF